MTKKEIHKLYKELHDNPLKLLQALGGYYECPRDESGQRLGPLVGYAGKDETGKQFVGDIYANFAVMEQYPYMFQRYAFEFFHEKFGEYEIAPDVFCGAPMGGLALAEALAIASGNRYAYPEKEYLSLATENTRAKTKMVFDRHRIHPGEKVAIVEDVTNNFTTTDDLIKLIEGNGARVVAIVCMLNRSLINDSIFNGIPIISRIRRKIDQYSQSDPGIAEEIARVGIVPKPKDEWHRIEAAMKKVPK